MACVRRRIDLFYDVLSPYTWLAFELLTRYRQVWSIDLRLKPFLLAGVFRALDASAPCENKKRYTRVDVRRLSEYYKVPLRMPSSVGAVLARGSLRAQLCLTAADVRVSPAEGGSRRLVETLSRALFTRVWNMDADITTDESLVEACREAGVPEGCITRDILPNIEDRGVKDRLRLYTQEALQLGCFGSPTILVHGAPSGGGGGVETSSSGDPDPAPRLYFGGDRMELIAHDIGERYMGPLPELSQIITR